MSSKNAKASKSVSRSKRAGLLFPVSRIARGLRKGRYAQRIGATAPIFLAGVLEYLAAEVLELAGYEADKLKKKRITPRHIMLGMTKDDELRMLTYGVTFSQAGVVPRICPELLPENNAGEGSSASPES